MLLRMLTLLSRQKLLCALIAAITAITAICNGTV